MRIDPAATIADIPALKIRALLQRGRDGRLDVRDACNVLRVDPNDARLVLHELEAEEYLERNPEYEDSWRPTVRGNALAMATTAPPVTRATAQRALDGLLSRVEEVNRAKPFLYLVRTVVVFGSYLGTARRLNDVDVAIALRPRYEDPALQHVEEMARWQGAHRTFQNFTQMLAWPRTEVWLFLRARSRVLSVHDLEHDGALVSTVPHRVLWGEW